MPTARLISTAALLSTATLLSCSLAACAPTERDAGRGADGTAAASDRPDENRLRQQTLDWRDCPAPSPVQGGGEAPAPLPDGTRWQCATMRAPLDWEKPGGKTIGIALIRARSSGDADDRLGSLLFNFGGPGGSGVAALPAFATDYEELRTRYDLVSFDPRGVGDSRGVRCLDPEAAQEAEEKVDQAPDDGGDESDALVELNELIAAACEKNSGDVLPYVGTTEAARDLDLMRQILGDEKLHYFGISYGTQLGGVYAHLFPERVGRAVLDGVVDPTQDMMEGALGQAAGFQLAFEHFARWCVEQRCTLGEDVEAIVETAVDLEAELDDTPLATSDGGELDGDEVISAITGSLYSQSFWPALLVGLEAVTGGDGDVLAELAEVLGQHGSGGDGDGGTEDDGDDDGTDDDPVDRSNENDAFRAITCDDSSDRYTVADVERRMPEFLEASPLFGPGLAWSALSCAGWPVPGEARHPEVSAPGAAPILLVGNTGDPATPYEGAARMAEALGEDVGFELTYRGEGHGAFDSGNPCVRDAVHTYLLDGRLPKRGAVCEPAPLPEGK
ncbi:alpha/beta hydrolase [Streptomyces rochei]|uniref:alpha/beta hydrolase n=1 Tax=Streptomyces TaxID=1883 RepID=UPI0002F461A9|nr:MULTISPECIES: alpha/beta hydrolase [Streptomyces]WDI19107.1 alpha/beta hydrolase [Streptomyces enissocaesilis]MDI3099293.1 alpha/beta hydrolase [Streptomyces sp. AN-3]QCR48173.1 alpha/beta hydrolase [Streptomyces sp. SGAir0924]RSS10077.1 alpha/beta hydrolase [Streptomyces sp. WAC08401]WQC13559.1 alpha/beta hydrolase [Streptomyces rochei]